LHETMREYAGLQLREAGEEDAVELRCARYYGSRCLRRIDDRVAQYCLLDALGCRAASSGQPRLAARLLGAAETVRIGAGASLIAILAPLVAGAEESAIAAIGASRFAAELEAGKRLSRSGAIGLAL